MNLNFEGTPVEYVMVKLMTILLKSSSGGFQMVVESIPFQTC